jgi:signal transduction histidine kinase
VRLADFIDSNLPAILDAWDAFARSLPPAHQMSPDALRDHAEQMLKAMAADLRTPQSPDEQHEKSLGSVAGEWRPPRTAAEVHAVLRASSGFTVLQLVSEYRALRASVLHLFAAAHEPEKATLRDIGRFNEALDQAIAESVEFYSLEVDRWRNIFLGVLGHDLRGPLNAILLTAQMLATSGRETKVTSRLIRSGERMRELLDDLLDYNRTSVGVGIPVRRTQCDLREICSEEIALRRTVHPEHRISFVSEPGVGVGSWDASRMRQALGNLVSNAAKYGDKEKRIVVTLASEGNVLKLSVENEGRDIAPEVAATWFEPYRRGREDHAGGDRENLGLGLFIVRQIALAHDGQVEVRSEGGRTRFTLAFPCAA